MMDQFYWAEKMSWLGVAPQPLKRNHLLLEETNDENIIEAAKVVAKAIYDALSAKTRTRAMEIAAILSLEVTGYDQFFLTFLLTDPWPIINVSFLFMEFFNVLSSLFFRSFTLISGN